MAACPQAGHGSVLGAVSQVQAHTGLLLLQFYRVLSTPACHQQRQWHQRTAVAGLHPVVHHRAFEQAFAARSRPCPDLQLQLQHSL